METFEVVNDLKTRSICKIACDSRVKPMAIRQNTCANTRRAHQDLDKIKSLQRLAVDSIKHIAHANCAIPKSCSALTD